MSWSINVRVEDGKVEVASASGQLPETAYFTLNGHVGEDRDDVGLHSMIYKKTEDVRAATA